MAYSRFYLHFRESPNADVLRSVLAELFGVGTDKVFVYTDAIRVFGSAELEADPTLDAAYRASSVHVLLRHYHQGSGPVAGWLCVEGDGADFDARTLARALAGAAASPFYYEDPNPACANNDSAQIEVAADGAERPVWLVEFGGPDRTTLTDLSDRPN